MPIQGPKQGPTNNGRQRYLADGVTTASPARLVVMLFERLVRDLSEGERSLRAGDLESAHRALLHAQEIVVELRSSLDVKRWEHAGKLDRIYEFLHQQLVLANVSKDPNLVEGVITLVDPLWDAWRQACALIHGARPIVVSSTSPDGSDAAPLARAV
jgi:flagellar secretion chaperone FliS